MTDDTTPNFGRVMRAIRKELRGVAYLPTARHYPFRGGTVCVYTPRDGDGAYQVGRLEYAVLDPFGRVVRRRRLTFEGYR